MKPVTDQSLLQQLENTPNTGQPDMLSSVLTPVQDPGVVSALDNMDLNDALRPRFQDPVITAPIQEAEATIPRLFDSALNDFGRMVYRGSGNVFEGFANLADRGEYQIQRLGQELFGAPEVVHSQPTISAPEGNLLSNFLRRQADKDFANANILEGNTVERPVAEDQLVTLNSVKEDPLNLGNTGRFALEQGIRSTPDMAAVVGATAVNPVAGLVTAAGLADALIAEGRAENRTGDRRDVSGTDLVEALPFAALSGVLDRIGATRALPSPTTAATGAGSRIAKETGKAAVTEAATEAVQENIELEGETRGIRDIQEGERFDRGLAGAIGGFTTGGATRAGTETGAEVTRRAGDFIQRATEAVQEARAPKVPSLENQQQETEAELTPEQNSRSRKVVTPNTGQEIDTEFEVLDVSELTPAERQGEFQPRERNRTALQAQVDNIVSNFDPERVGESRTSDTGAPIIASDSNIVESGNGRTAAITRIYEENPEAAGAYRQFIQNQGFNVDGIERPILVRRRKTELTPDDRQSFITDSNESEKASISTTERARIDAERLTPDDLALIGDAQNINASSNAKFVSQFMKKVATANDRNALVNKDGSGLSQDGVRRVQSAILAKAYNDPDVVQRLMESTDNNVKAIGNAMLNIAGRWTKAKADGIPDNLDISDNITEAMRIISRARDNNSSVADAINQPDLERGNINPITEQLIRSFYNEDLTRAKSQKAIQSILDYYVQEASKASDQDTLIDLEPVTPETLIEQAVSRRDGSDQPNLGLTGNEGATTAATATLQDAETTLFDDGAVQETDGDTVPTRGEGGADPSSNQFGFAAQAFTDRPSWQRKIFTDANVDPDAALNFAPERQQKIMQKAIKDRYGINVTVDKGTPINKALDQMSDLYANLEQFVHVLGLPPSAMSLSDAKNGRPALTLRLQKNAPYLGVFHPSENTIGLPGRSNSFAHEWAHALDFFMLEQIENTKMYEGMSGKVRNAGADYTPGTASEAWVHLMQNIFFEQDALAAEIVRIETQLEKTKSKKQRAELEQRMESIKSGKTQIRSGRTDYYKKATKIGTSYWTKPTEMLARSFEAYIANKVQAAGGSLEVLSKSDKGYMNSSDSRFVQTFPRQSDRDNIFRAYDMLFENLSTQSILNPNGDPVQTPTTDENYLDANVIWRRDNPNAPPKGLKGLYQREVNGLQQQIRELMQEKERPQNDRKTMDRVANGLSYVLSSDQQVFRMMENRYKGARSLKQLANLYAKRPGSDFSGFIDEKGNRWGTYEEEVDTNHKKYHNIMMRIMDQYGLDQTNKEQMSNLRSALLGQDGKKTPKPITKAAAELRKLVYNSLWSHGDGSGMKIGFVKDIAFLNRIMDVPIIATQQEGFLQKAAEVYGIEFENALGNEGSIDISVIMEMFKEIDGKFVAQGKSPRYRTRGEGSNETVKTIRKLINDLQQAEDPDQIKQIEQNIQDAVSQIYGEMKNDYSELSAQSWLMNLLSPVSSMENFNPPRASFIKARTLPKETDTIMAEFMINNPVELMNTYIMQMSAEAAYQRRKSKTDQYLNALTKEGVHRDDIDTVVNIIDTITGRADRDYFGRKTHTFFNGLRALGTLYLLPRAVFASLPEAMTLGIRTGNAMDGLHAMALVVKDVTGNFKSTQERMEFAQEIGLIANAIADQAIANRLGGTFEDSPRWNKLMRNMFERTLLAPLTRKQHAAVISVGDVFVRRISKKILDAEAKGLTGQKSRYNTYVSDLVELGVPRSEVSAFAKWITDKQGERVSLDEIENTPNGQAYRIALERLRSESIQTSAAVERSSFAKSDVGRVVMGITSFMFSYFENIVKATPRRVWRTYLESGAPMAMQRAIIGYLPAAMQLWFAHTMVMLLRTALFNPDRLEEWEKEGDLVENLMIAGLSQMGLYGPGGDVFVNAFEGVRYQRDLANMAVGPYAGTYLQNTQRTIKPFTAPNSEKTNTTEFGALQGAYGLMSPMISYGLNYIPAGPIAGRGLGLINMYATSGAASEHFAETIIGPKGGETKENFQRGKE